MSATTTFWRPVESGAALAGARQSMDWAGSFSGNRGAINVDLGKEFVDMILPSAFRRTLEAITTSDEMLQELVNLKR